MVVDRAATGNGEGGAAYLLPPASALASLSHTYLPESSRVTLLLVKSNHSLQVYYVL